MALDRYEWLGRLAARIPEEALVMATYIGAVAAGGMLVFYGAAFQRKTRNL